MSGHFTHTPQSHGRDVLLLERRAFLELLYDTLPDKSKILFNKQVTEVVESKDGVEVFFADGTSEKGDVVVGSDGVHSAVRQAMWDHANAAEPGTITVQEKKGIPMSDRCVFSLTYPGSSYHDHVDVPLRFWTRGASFAKRAERQLIRRQTLRSGGHPAKTVILLRLLEAGKAVVAVYSSKIHCTGRREGGCKRSRPANQ